MQLEVNGYDHVVVGAGSAGCVLAARLAEDPAARVLLIEAGHGPGDTPVVPAAWPTLLTGPMSWPGETVAQLSTGVALGWPRGRGLGGSSSINGMVFVRGHRSSYDAWADSGAKGWAFGDLLPYFRRSESAPHRDPALRGTDGPMRVSPVAPPHPVIAAGLEAAAEAGHPVAGDISSGTEEGFGLPDLTIVDGRRQSAADAYLVSATGRANLDIVTGALVHRITREGGRCTGVLYSVGTQQVSVRATAEVVLCAGTIGSPEILMRSGIGSADDLRDLGIESAVHLPGVGENLHDHPMTGITYEAAAELPASINNHGEALGLIRSDAAKTGPDIQILLVATPYFAPTLQGPTEGYTIAVGLMTPQSRGRIRLKDALPTSAPLMDPRYLEDPRDLDALNSGLRAAREIGNTAALSRWRGREVLPGPGVTDASLREYTCRSMMTYFHYVGTCKMGTDDASVVDERLRVHGVENLRVADASIIPAIPSANTNATVLAIAERAAEMIAEDHREVL